MTTQLLRLHISRLTFLLFFLNTTLPTNAQIQWQQTFGGSAAEDYATVSGLATDGLIVASASQSGISGNKTEPNQGGYDCWIKKLDASGVIQWQKNIGGSGDDAPSSIKQTPDGGYIVAIYSTSGISGDKTEANRGNLTSDIWVVKLDAVGNIQWQKTIGGSSNDLPSGIEILPNSGGYIIAGTSDSPISGDKTAASFGRYDFWLVELGINGNIVSDKSFGFNGDETLTSFQKTSDGGFIIGGYIYQSTNTGMTTYGVYDMWVIKTDASGTVVWQKIYGGSNEDILLHVREHSDGDFVLTGLTNSPISGVKTEPHCGGPYDVWALKINNLGAIVWQNTIGTNNWDSGIQSMETNDGGHLLVCNSEGGINGDKTLPNNGNSDFWLVKTDNLGVIQWQKVVGGAGYETPMWGHLLPDQSIIIGGMSDSGVSGDKTSNSFGGSDTWVVKLGNSVPPSTPSVSNLNLCQNTAASPLTAVGQNLLWYTTQTGGVGSSTAPTPATTTVGTTTYYVSQTVNGVESPRVALGVTILSNPTATINGSNPRCSYATSPTTVSATNNPAWQYTWNTGATGSYISVTPSVSTTYTVTVTSANGCTASASYTLPVININAQIVSANSFCKGVSNTLTATGGTSYVWSTGHQAATITQTLNQPRTYSVTVSQSGCSRVATKTITVDQPFTAQITGLANSYPQNAAPVTLTGTPAGGAFTINNVPATVLNPSTLNLGFHVVRYTVAQGACTATRAKTVAINAPTVNLAIPTQNHFSAKTHFNKVQLDWVNTSGKSAEFFVVEKQNTFGQFVDYQTVIANEKNSVNTVNTFIAQDAQPTEGENLYRIKTVFTDGTEQLSDIKTVKFSKNSNVSVFPNPAAEALEVNLADYVGKSVSLSFFNTFGQLVFTQNIQSVQNTVERLDLSTLGGGLYQMRVSSPQKRDAVVKVVVSK